MLLLCFCCPEMSAAPCEEKEKAAAADSEAASREREPETFRERAVEYVEKKVLVVDDDAMNRKLAALCLLFALLRVLIVC